MVFKTGFIAMNQIFKPYLRKFIIVFFYDILIYSATFNDHLLHFTTAFQVLQNGEFHLKLSKCCFAWTLIEYLGHLVSAAGVEQVPKKVKADQQRPPLRSFSGLAWIFWSDGVLFQIH